MATDGDHPRGHRTNSTGDAGNVRLAGIDHNLLARIHVLEAENSLLREQHDRAVQLATADRQSRDQYRRDLHHERQRRNHVPGRTVPLDVHERVRNQRDEVIADCDALRQGQIDLNKRTRVAEEDREGMAVRLGQAFHDLTQARVELADAEGNLALINLGRARDVVEMGEVRSRATRLEDNINRMEETHRNLVMELRLQLLGQNGVVPREERYNEA